VQGLTGIFRHLAQEHGEVSALLMQLKASSDPDKCRELFSTIRYELLAHEQGELRELYPVLHDNVQTRAIAEAHEKDAKSLEKAIVALRKVALDSPTWQPTLDRLIEHVQAHVHEEESEYFPLAQRVFGERANELLERYEQSKVAAMRELKAAP
jgi:hemerythrin-like domain-containing protein